MTAYFGFWYKWRREGRKTGEEEEVKESLFLVSLLFVTLTMLLEFHKSLQWSRKWLPGIGMLLSGGCCHWRNLCCLPHLTLFKTLPLFSSTPIFALLSIFNFEKKVYIETLKKKKKRLVFWDISIEINNFKTLTRCTRGLLISKKHRRTLSSDPGSCTLTVHYSKNRTWAK